MASFDLGKLWDKIVGGVKSVLQGNSGQTKETGNTPQKSTPTNQTVQSQSQEQASRPSSTSWNPKAQMESALKHEAPTNTQPTTQRQQQSSQSSSWNPAAQKQSQVTTQPTTQAQYSQQPTEPRAEETIRAAVQNTASTVQESAKQQSEALSQQKEAQTKKQESPWDTILKVAETAVKSSQLAPLANFAEAVSKKTTPEARYSVKTESDNKEDKNKSLSRVINETASDIISTVPKAIANIQNNRKIQFGLSDAEQERIARERGASEADIELAKQAFAENIDYINRNAQPGHKYEQMLERQMRTAGGLPMDSWLRFLPDDDGNIIDRSLNSARAGVLMHGQGLTGLQAAIGNRLGANNYENDRLNDYRYQQLLAQQALSGDNQGAYDRIFANSVSNLLTGLETTALGQLGGMSLGTNALENVGLGNMSLNAFGNAYGNVMTGGMGEQYAGDADAARRYAYASALNELGQEKLFDALGLISGGKITENTIPGANVFGLGSFMTEAAEEGAGALVDPFTEAALEGNIFSPEYWNRVGEIYGEQGLAGTMQNVRDSAIEGGVGGVMGGVMSNPVQSARQIGTDINSYREVISAAKAIRDYQNAMADASATLQSAPNAPQNLPSFTGGQPVLAARNNQPAIREHLQPGVGAEKVSADYNEYTDAENNFLHNNAENEKYNDDAKQAETNRISTEGVDTIDEFGNRKPVEGTTVESANENIKQYEEGGYDGLKYNQKAEQAVSQLRKYLSTGALRSSGYSTKYAAQKANKIIAQHTREQLGVKIDDAVFNNMLKVSNAVGIPVEFLPNKVFKAGNSSGWFARGENGRALQTGVIQLPADITDNYFKAESSGSYTSLFMHEVMHTIEGSQAYFKLKKALIDKGYFKYGKNGQRYDLVSPVSFSGGGYTFTDPVTGEKTKYKSKKDVPHQGQSYDKLSGTWVNDADLLISASPSDNSGYHGTEHLANMFGNYSVKTGAMDTLANGDTSTRNNPRSAEVKDHIAILKHAYDAIRTSKYVHPKENLLYDPTGTKQMDASLKKKGDFEKRYPDYSRERAKEIVKYDDEKIDYNGSREFDTPYEYNFFSSSHGGTNQFRVYQSGLVGRDYYRAMEKAAKEVDNAAISKRRQIQTDESGSYTGDVEKDEVNKTKLFPQSVTHANEQNLKEANKSIDVDSIVSKSNGTLTAEQVERYLGSSLEDIITDMPQTLKSFVPSLSEKDAWDIANKLISSGKITEKQIGAISEDAVQSLDKINSYANAIKALGQEQEKQLKAVVKQASKSKQETSPVEKATEFGLPEDALERISEHVKQNGGKADAALRRRLIDEFGYTQLQPATLNDITNIYRTRNGMKRLGNRKVEQRRRTRRDRINFPEFNKRNAEIKAIKDADYKRKSAAYDFDVKSDNELIGLERKLLKKSDDRGFYETSSARDQILRRITGEKKSERVSADKGGNKYVINKDSGLFTGSTVSNVYQSLLEDLRMIRESRDENLYDLWNTFNLTKKQINIIAKVVGSKRYGGVADASVRRYLVSQIPNLKDASVNDITGIYRQREKLLGYGKEENKAQMLSPKEYREAVIFKQSQITFLQNIANDIKKNGAKSTRLADLGYEVVEDNSKAYLTGELIDDTYERFDEALDEIDKIEKDENLTKIEKRDKSVAVLKVRSDDKQFKHSPNEEIVEEKKESEASPLDKAIDKGIANAEEDTANLNARAAEMEKNIQMAQYFHHEKKPNNYFFNDRGELIERATGKVKRLADGSEPTKDIFRPIKENEDIDILTDEGVKKYNEKIIESQEFAEKVAESQKEKRGPREEKLEVNRREIKNSILTGVATIYNANEGGNGVERVEQYFKNIGVKEETAKALAEHVVDGKTELNRDLIKDAAKQLAMNTKDAKYLSRTEKNFTSSELYASTAEMYAEKLAETKSKFFEELQNVANDRKYINDFTERQKQAKEEAEQKAEEEQKPVDKVEENVPAKEEKTKEKTKEKKNDKKATEEDNKKALIKEFSKKYQEAGVDKKHAEAFAKQIVETNKSGGGVYRPALEDIKKNKGLTENEAKEKLTEIRKELSARKTAKQVEEKVEKVNEVSKEIRGKEFTSKEQESIKGAETHAAEVKQEQIKKTQARANAHVNKAEISDTLQEKYSSATGRQAAFDYLSKDLGVEENLANDLTQHMESPKSGEFKRSGKYLNEQIDEAAKQIAENGKYTYEEAKESLHKAADAIGAQYTGSSTNKKSSGKKKPSSQSNARQNKQTNNQQTNIQQDAGQQQQDRMREKANERRTRPEDTSIHETMKKLRKNKNVDPSITARIEESLLRKAVVHDEDVRADADEWLKEGGLKNAVSYAEGILQQNNPALTEEEVVYLERAFEESNKLSQDITAQIEKLEKANRPEDKEALSILRDEQKRATDNATTVVEAMANAASEAGRVVRVMRFLQQSPATSANYLQRTIDKLNETYKKDLKGKKLTLDQSLVDEYVNAKDDKAREAAMEKIEYHIADQLPRKAGDMVKQWRMTCMLTNPRTHMRNFLSNIATSGLFRLTDQTQAGIEWAITKNKGLQKALGYKESDRRAVLGVVGKEYKEVAEWLDKTHEFSKERNGNGKFSEYNARLAAGAFSNKNIFGKALNAVNAFNNKALAFEDRIFVQSRARIAMAQMLQSQGYTVERDGDGFNIKNKDGKHISDKVLKAMEREALHDAQEATYHDFNQMAKWLNDTKKKMGKAGVALDVVVPFVKTPANILNLSLQYSPVGLMYHATADLGKVRSGDMSASTYVNRLSRGITGTALFMIGAALANGGLISKPEDDDEDGRTSYYQSNIFGRQPLALHLGDKYYSLDWAMPTAAPFMMGASFAGTLGRYGKNLFDLDELPENMAGIIQDTVDMMNPVLEASYLSSLNDMLTSFVQGSNYGGEIFGAGFAGGMERVGESVAENFVGQLSPTFGGAINRTIDPVKRTTSANTSLERMKNRTLMNIPGMSKYLQPAIDQKGQELENFDFGIDGVGRAIYNTLVPSTITVDTHDDFDSALMDVGASALPRNQTGKGGLKGQIYYDLEKMGLDIGDITSEEYTQVKKTYYGNYRKYAEAYNELAEYNNLGTHARDDVYKKIEQLALAEAKSVYYGRIGNVDELYSAEQIAALELKKLGVSPAQFYLMKDCGLTGNRRAVYVADELERLGVMNEVEQAILNQKCFPSAFGLTDSILVKTPDEREAAREKYLIEDEYETLESKVAAYRALSNEEYEKKKKQDSEETVQESWESLFEKYDKKYGTHYADAFAKLNGKENTGTSSKGKGAKGSKGSSGKKSSTKTTKTTKTKTTKVYASRGRSGRRSSGGGGGGSSVDADSLALFEQFMKYANGALEKGSSKSKSSIKATVGTSEAALFDSIVNSSKSDVEKLKRELGLK